MIVTYPPEMLPSPDEGQEAEVIVDGVVVYRTDATDHPSSADAELVEWRPIKTAPYQKIVEVKNDLMNEPVRATRGFVDDLGVHPDKTFFTSVFTPHKFFPFPAGKLVCPTHWRPLQDKEGEMK